MASRDGPGEEAGVGPAVTWRSPPVSPRPLARPVPALGRPPALRDAPRADMAEVFARPTPKRRASLRNILVDEPSRDPAPVPTCASPEECVRLVHTFVDTNDRLKRMKASRYESVHASAPLAVVEGMERKLAEMEAVNRRHFENAFCAVVDQPFTLQKQALTMPFLFFRLTTLATVIRHNRVADPDDLGVSPEFALHALRCANWNLVLDNRGCARVIPSALTPLRVTLFGDDA